MPHEIRIAWRWLDGRDGGGWREAAGPWVSDPPSLAVAWQLVEDRADNHRRACLPGPPEAEYVVQVREVHPWEVLPDDSPVKESSQDH